MVTVQIQKYKIILNHTRKYNKQLNKRIYIQWIFYVLFKLFLSLWCMSRFFPPVFCQKAFGLDPLSLFYASNNVINLVISAAIKLKQIIMCTIRWEYTKHTSQQLLFVCNAQPDYNVNNLMRTHDSYK